MVDIISGTIDIVLCSAVDIILYLSVRRNFPGYRVGIYCNPVFFVCQMDMPEI